MKTLTLIFTFCTTTLSFVNFSQIITSNGATVFVSSGGVLFCNGGATFSNSTQFTNHGTVTTNKNSTLPQAGTFELNSNTSVSGNGTYRIEQDWINDAIFNGDNSEVVLFGNSEQFITSTVGIATSFNDLTLTGSGTNNNRKKTLLNTNASTGVTGVLNLNDRELSTNTNSFTIENPDPTAIIHLSTFNNEGFVSSLTNGFLIRNTNQQTEYLFPVGSSDGTLRYRPVTINPNSAVGQTYEVRLNNFSADNEGYFLSQHESIIDIVNPLFYHSIRRSVGTTNADIKLFFIPSVDKDWSSFAHWRSGDQSWIDVEDAIENTASNFKFVLKNNWDFPTNGDQYALVNITQPFSIPNVFTPNGDGVNDIFFITSAGLTDFNMVIVNRWGEKVFETSDPNEGWNGTTNGKKCSDGVYFITMTAKQKSNAITKHGHITINGN